MLLQRERPLRFRARLADVVKFEDVQPAPSVRKFLPQIAEACRFSLAGQMVAEAESSIPARPGDILMLGLPWRYHRGEAAYETVAERNRVVLLTLRDSRIQQPGGEVVP